MIMTTFWAEEAKQIVPDPPSSLSRLRRRVLLDTQSLNGRSPVEHPPANRSASAGNIR